MYEQDLALNNLQGLYVIKPNQPANWVSKKLALNRIISVRWTTEVDHSNSVNHVAELARAAEYSDYIPAEGRVKTPPTSVLDMTLNNLMVRLQ